MRSEVIVRSGVTVRHQLGEIKTINLELYNKLQVSQVKVSVRSEVIVRSWVTVRHQLGEIKTINLELYNKLQVSQVKVNVRSGVIMRLQIKEIKTGSP